MRLLSDNFQYVEVTVFIVFDDECQQIFQCSISWVKWDQ